MTAQQEREAKARKGSRKLCADFDGDCYTIKNKRACYAYDPAQGYCPFIGGADR